MTLRDDWRVMREELTTVQRVKCFADLATMLIGTIREDEIRDTLFNEDWDEIGIALLSIGYIDDEDLTG